MTDRQIAKHEGDSLGRRIVYQVLGRLIAVAAIVVPLIILEAIG